MDQTPVSLFASPLDKAPQTVLLGKVLSDFKSGLYANQINYVREVFARSGSDAYRAVKKTLPAIAFCGEFSGGHAKGNLIRINNLLVFDIDHLSSDEMVFARSKMSTDDYILAFWVSPSGNGFKGLIRLSYSGVPSIADLDSCYKRAFELVYIHFQDKLGLELDTSCSDYSRICYVCWDDELYYNQHAIAFPVDCGDVFNRKVSTANRTNPPNSSLSGSRVFKPVNVPGRNNQRSRCIISSIIKYLSKRNLSITSTYDEWLRVGFAIANTFNYDLGVKYFLALSRLDKGKYNETICIEKIQECYMKGTGEITLGTIIDMAQKKGYVYKGSSEDS